MVYPLKPHPSLVKPKGPVVLCILDGIGLGQGGEDDAVATAHTPNLDRYLATCPWTPLAAHGTAVGLPSEKDMGNSEVGHNAFGAGRVFDQGAKLVEQALNSGAAFETDVWKALTERPTLHLLGLLSDGNVHSHIDHLYLLIARAAADGVKRLRVHALTDGRDVGARTALTYFGPLEQVLQQHRDAGRDYRLASGGGRMHITLDRYEADWPMVQRGWQCHVHGVGRPFPSAVQAIETLYAEDPEVDDQWLPAFVLEEDGQPVGKIQDHDAVLLFNFRGDRAIEISEAFTEEDFQGFPQPEKPQNLLFAGMTQYDGDTQTPEKFLVNPPAISETVGEYLIQSRLRTFAVSETQKFGHVTFFFNGNRSGYLDDTYEQYLEIPSDNLPFNQKPEMKAREIADAAIGAIQGDFDHVRLNLANGDMVGHTGHLQAARTAVEVVDTQLARIERAVRDSEGLLVITADHGNADEMFLRKGSTILRDASGQPLRRTSHTLNPVPFILVDPTGKRDVLRTPESSIASVGTSILSLCGLASPTDYRPGLVRTR